MKKRMDGGVKNEMRREWFHQVRSSIAGRISLLLLITVLTPTIIVQMHLTSRYEDNLEQYVQSYMVNAFEETFNGVESCFDEMKSQANYLFSSSALMDARSHPYQGYDRTLLEDHRKISLAFSNCSRIFPDTPANYTYLLEDGRIFGTWGTLRFPTNTEWLREIQNQLPSVGGFTWFDLPGDENASDMNALGQSIVVAKRMSMSPFSSVLVSLSNDAFLEKFAPLDDRAEHTRLMLFDQSGEQMLITNADVSLKLSELVQEGLRQSDYETQVFKDGSRYVITRRLRSNHWVLVRSLDDSSTFYGDSAASGLSTVVIALFFLVLTAIMMAVVFRTTNGIKRLDTAVRDFAADQQLHLLPVSGVDEVATLTYHFNQMQERIQELMRKAQEDEKEKVRLYYEAQMAEISPHFLYNTLNSIKWAAIFSNAQNVADLISDLGALLEKHTSRYGEIVTLEETLDTLKHYMNLQYARFGERVKLQKDIPAEALDLLIPKFAVQPLVENALLHGYEQQQRKGIIRLSVQLMEDSMLLLVSDDGVGMTQERILEVESELVDGSARVKRRSIGLQNVHRRTRYLYGPAFGLMFCSAEGEGTTMRLRLPIQHASMKEDEDVPGHHR